MRFFTDGSARYPRHSVARLATWAVVQDTSTCELQMRQAADFLFLSPPQFPKFHVSAVGIVPGDQTVARAELYAILHAAKQVSYVSPYPFSSLSLMHRTSVALLTSLTARHSNQFCTNFQMVI